MLTHKGGRPRCMPSDAGSLHQGRVARVISRHRTALSPQRSPIRRSHRRASRAHLERRQGLHLRRRPLARAGVQRLVQPATRPRMGRPARLSARLAAARARASHPDSSPRARLPRHLRARLRHRLQRRARALTRRPLGRVAGVRRQPPHRLGAHLLPHARRDCPRRGRRAILGDRQDRLPGLRGPGARVQPLV